MGRALITIAIGQIMASFRRRRFDRYPIQDFVMHHAHLSNVSLMKTEFIVPQLLTSLFRAYNGHTSISIFRIQALTKILNN